MVMGMVKDFIIITTNCPYCVRWKMAKVLAQADVDIIDYHSGDPRIKNFESQVPNTSEMLPIGVMKNTAFQSSRDLTFMYLLLKR